MYYTLKVKGKLYLFQSSAEDGVRNVKERAKHLNKMQSESLLPNVPQPKKQQVCIWMY